MTNMLLILAEASAPAAGASNPLKQFIDSGMLLPLGFILMFYFLLIRPQQKQKKEHAKRISELKKGDKVVTNGGIHGTINHKSDSTVSLRIADGVFITIETANISTVSKSGNDKKEEEKK